MNLPQFKNQKLLDLAFIHRSYLNENPNLGLSSNERLEFLGDAVLSLTVSEFLYQKFPHYNEGDLTALRSAMVKTKTLAHLAQTLDLGSRLKLSRGEEESGGRKNLTLLANVFESVIGALYLDQGLSSVKKFIQTVLLPEIEEIIKTGAYKDAKSEFQEVVQDKLRFSPVYKVLKSEGPDHAKIFTIGVYVQGKLFGQGSGHSKQEAEEVAAVAALAKWVKK